MYLATTNKCKIEEYTAVFTDFQSIQLHLDEIQSLHTQKIVKNTLDQVEMIVDNERLSKGVVVDDIAFSMNCLRGFPGTYVKDFESKNPNYYTIASKLQDFYAYVEHSIGWTNGSDQMIFTSTHRGKITLPRSGFGTGFYEVFIPENESITYSQMQTDYRMQHHPRGENIRSLLKYLASFDAL